MLDSAYLDVTLYQRRGEGRFSDVLRRSRDFYYRVEVDAAEDDAGIHGSRTHGEIYLLTSVQTDSGGPDDVLQCSLSDHSLATLAGALRRKSQVPAWSAW